MIRTSRGKMTAAHCEAIRILEAKHRLKIVKKEVQPTIKFLAELAIMLYSVLGKLTISEAYQVWIIAHQYGVVNGAMFQMQSDISYWYGVNAFGLSDQHLSALNANLPRVKAQSRLHDGNFSARDPQAVFDLVMTAYNDEQMALEARAEAIKSLMKKEGQ